MLKFFNHPEGYVEPNNESDLSQGFNYVYQYKDHLGNIRLSYADLNKDGVITGGDFSGTSSSITVGVSTPVFDASWTAGGNIDNSLHATDKMKPANFGKIRRGYTVDQSGMGPGGSWGAGGMYSFGTTKTF